MENKEKRYSMKLGRSIYIGSKTKVDVCNPGRKVEYFTDTVSVLFGIGNDNTAELIMSIEAWEALVNNEDIILEQYIMRNRTDKKPKSE